MNFLTWRISYQSDEQALKAAFSQITALSTQLAAAKSQLLAIANKPRSEFEDADEFKDWAAGEALRTLTNLSMESGASKTQITRSPGRCASCSTLMGERHAPSCKFVNLLQQGPI